jgi:hypothetical protein
MLKSDPRVTYPVCIDGKRACPPEDCDGPWTFMAILHALYSNAMKDLGVFEASVRGHTFNPARDFELS